MQRAALYIRVSTDEQAIRGYSLEAQKENLITYVREHNMMLVGTYIDEGFSARKKYTSRKEFMRMIEDVKSDKIDIILFIKMDRWFRNISDYYKVQEILDKYHVNWKATMESYDTATASGRLNLNIRLSIAQNESDMTSERIKFVFESKVKRGEVISGHVPMGFRIENKRIVHDPELVPIVRDIYNHFGEHNSMYAAIAYCREKYDINFTAVRMKELLSKPLYKGEFHGEYGFVEPIITAEQFDNVQTFLAKNIKRPLSDRVYLFTGMVVCEECKHKMSIRVVCPDSKVYIYYRCQQYARRKLCSHKNDMREDRLEKYLLENIEAEIKGYIARYQLAAAAQAPRSTVDKAKIKSKIERLKELYINELINLDTYKSDYAMYTKQLEQEANYDTPKDNIPKLNEFLDSNFLSVYKSLSKSERRNFWRKIITEIHLDSENRITLFFD